MQRNEIWRSYGTDYKEMTKRLLKLKQMPKLDDTADALAIAICHTQANGSPLREFLSRNGV